MSQNVDAVVRSVEAVARNVDAIARNVDAMARSVEAVARSVEALVALVATDGENIRSLARIAEAHERRLDRLDGSSAA